MAQPFDLLQTVTEMNEFVEIIVTKTMNGRHSLGQTLEDELKAFLGLDFIMGINKLPFLGDYWSTDKYIRNEKIQNAIDKNKVSVHLTEF